MYVLDIDVTRNGNNLKLKVKSEFSLSMGLMVINHSNPYIHSKVDCVYIGLLWFITIKPIPKENSNLTFSFKLFPFLVTSMSKTYKKE